MCLVVLAWRTDPRWPLILASNRDERHGRPSLPVARWTDVPDMFGGRDQEAGGTWLAASPGGRFAAVTNVRVPGPGPVDAPSRGVLPVAFLTGDEDAASHARRVHEQGHRWSPFNLLIGDGRTLWWTSNRTPGPLPLEPGFHGLSNAALNTPWPKVTRSVEALRRALERDVEDDEALFALLSDPTPPPDEELPDTGVGLPLERLLGSPLIVGPGYGTRATTVLRVRADGAVTLQERRRDAYGNVFDESTVEF